MEIKIWKRFVRLKPAFASFSDYTKIQRRRFAS